MKYTAIAVVALILVGVAVYFLNTPAAKAPTAAVDSSEMETGTETETLSESEQAAETGVGTLADFYGRGESVYCTFSGASDDSTTGEGEFWYDDARLRVEAITRADGEVYTSNMINDGEQVYVWSGTASGMQAMVMPADSTNAPAAYEQYQTGQADARVSMEQEVSYSCEPWAPRDSQFVPPSNIEFMDMEMMMQGAFEGEMRGAPEGMSF